MSVLKRIGWEPFGWLIYSLPYLVTSLFASLSAGEKAMHVAFYVAFLVFYLGGQLVRGPRILWMVAGLDAVAIAGSVQNPAASSFFIYASALIGRGFEPRTAMRVLAAQVLVGAALSAAIEAQWWFYMASVVVSALIGAVTIQAAARAAGDAKLRLAQEEVERLAKLAERERIARDLHDVLGHTLSVVVLKTELARKLLPRDPARAQDEIAEVERIARQGLADVREAITGYRASGLSAEIERVRATLTAAGIDAAVDARPVPLTPEQETALSLALREAATNVIRHAAATRCQIRFYEQDGSVLLEIQDDGKGGDAVFGHGLTGMRERIQALGGVMSKSGDHGTRLLITLPLKAT